VRFFRKIFFTAIFAAILSFNFSSWAQNKENPELTKTLAQIDAVSAKFSSFEAKFTQKQYVALLKIYEPEETGEFYYALDKNRAVQLRQEVITPRAKSTTIKGDLVTVYTPAIKQAHTYNLGKRKNMVEYLATGLGQSSAKLREQFDIAYDGAGDVGGEPCSILTLVPKDKSVAASIKSITIWLKKSTGTPAQYKFLEPTNNYLLETFSGEKLNGKIPDDKFEQRLPKGTEILPVN
jgi:outer membrane lipoprotein-sorting protein